MCSSALRQLAVGSELYQYRYVVSDTYMGISNWRVLCGVDVSPSSLFFELSLRQYEFV